jgi:hypothetical protein
MSPETQQTDYAFLAAEATPEVCHRYPGGSSMSVLAQYIEEMVEPTFNDFESNQTPRHAFLVSVVIFHAIDRAAEDLGKRKPGNLRKDWGEMSADFKIVDVIAHRLKHVRSDDENQPRRLKDGTTQWGDLTYGWAISRMTILEFTFIARRAIGFIKEQSKRIAQKPPKSENA